MKSSRGGAHSRHNGRTLGTAITLLVTTILQQCQRLSNGALVYQIWLFGYKIGANDCCMWNAVCSKATTTHSNKAHMLTYNLCIAWGSQQPNHLCALSTSHKVTKSQSPFIIYTNSLFCIQCIVSFESGSSGVTLYRTDTFLEAIDSQTAIILFRNRSL
jgi:hypothetical protein